LVGGAGGSLSGLGDFGGVQAEGAADRGESLPGSSCWCCSAGTRNRGYATQTGASGLLPADGLVAETRDGVEVALSGLACLLVVAVTSAAGEGWSSPDFARTSGAHPTDNDRKSAWLVPATAQKEI